MKLNLFILASLMLVVGTSCSKEVALDIREDANPDSVAVKLTLIPSPIDDSNVIVLGDNNVSTKSSYSGSNSNDTIWEINSDVNYYLFRNGTLAKQGYVADYRDLSITCPSSSYTYTLYLVMNYGAKKSLSSNQSESYMTNTYELSYSTNSETYHDRIQTYGLPRYGKITNFSASYSGSFNMTTLAHKLIVRIDKTQIPQLSERQIVINSMQIVHGTNTVKPFVSSSKRSSNWNDNLYIEGVADVASASDIESLNNNGEAVFYLLENMCGTYPSITSWEDKVPQNLPSDGNISKRASILSFNCTETTVSSSLSSVTYRCYLGSSPSDFNIRRNYITYITPTFSSSFVDDSDWTSEHGNASERIILSPYTNGGGSNILLCNYPLTAYVCQYGTNGYDLLPSRYINDITIGNCITTGLTSVPKPSMTYTRNGNGCMVNFSTTEKVEYMGEWGQEPLYAVFPVYISLTDGRVIEQYVKIQKSAFNVHFTSMNGQHYYDPATSNSDSKFYYDRWFGIVGDSYTEAFMNQNDLHFSWNYYVRDDYAGGYSTVYGSERDNMNEGDTNIDPWSSTFVYGMLDYKPGPWDYTDYHAWYFFPSKEAITYSSSSRTSASSVGGYGYGSYNVSNIAHGCFNYNTATYTSDKGVLSQPFSLMMSKNSPGAFREYETVLHTDAGFYHFPGFLSTNNTLTFSAQLVLQLGIYKGLNGNVKYYNPFDMIVGGEDIGQGSTLDYRANKGNLLPIHFPFFQSEAIDYNLYKSGCTQDYCSYWNKSRAFNVGGEVYYRIDLHASQCFNHSTDIHIVTKLINHSQQELSSVQSLLPVYKKKIEKGYMDNPSYSNLNSYMMMLDLQIQSPFFTLAPLGVLSYIPINLTKPGLFIAFRGPHSGAIAPIDQYYMYALQRLL